MVVARRWLVADFRTAHLVTCPVVARHLVLRHRTAGAVVRVRRRRGLGLGTGHLADLMCDRRRADDHGEHERYQLPNHPVPTITPFASLPT